MLWLHFWHPSAVVRSSHVDGRMHYSAVSHALQCRLVTLAEHVRYIVDLEVNCPTYVLPITSTPYFAEFLYRILFHFVLCRHHVLAPVKPSPYCLVRPTFTTAFSGSLNCPGSLSFILKIMCLNCFIVSNRLVALGLSHRPLAEPCQGTRTAGCLYCVIRGTHSRWQPQAILIVGYISGPSPTPRQGVRSHLNISVILFTH